MNPQEKRKYCPNDGTVVVCMLHPLFQIQMRHRKESDRLHRALLKALLEEAENARQVLLDLGVVLFGLGFVVHLFGRLARLLLALVVLLLLLLLPSILLLLLALSLPSVVRWLSAEWVSRLVMRLAELFLVVTQWLASVVGGWLGLATGKINVDSTLVLLRVVLQAQLAADVLDCGLDLLDMVDRVVSLANDTLRRESD